MLWEVSPFEFIPNKSKFLRVLEISTLTLLFSIGRKYRILIKKTKQKELNYTFITFNCFWESRKIFGTKM